MTFFNEKRPLTGCDKRGEDVLREADKLYNKNLGSDYEEHIKELKSKGRIIKRIETRDFFLNLDITDLPNYG